MKINDAKTLGEMNQAVSDTFTKTGEEALLNALELVSRHISLDTKQTNLLGILYRRKNILNTKNDTWNTDLDNDVVRPITRKAITLYAEQVLDKQKLEVEINGYKVRMMLNPILHENIFKILHPIESKADNMINVEVGIPSGDKIIWYVGIYYKFKDEKWIERNESKRLTTYQGKIS